jgi:DNA-binding MarR family transcriptional regulator
MGHIAFADESLGTGELTGRLGISPAATTELVDRLERAGHVRRGRDEADRRRVVLEMSPSATAAGTEFFGGLQRDLVAAMAGYTEEELAVVGRFLAGMTEVIVAHQRPQEGGAQR